MGKEFSTAVPLETAVLVGVITGGQKKEQAEEHLEELAFLVDTAGAKVKESFTQKLDHPDVSTFVGKGKLEEIRQYVFTEKIDLVVFDDELSGSQLRNIEKALNCKILDRNNLILDIFAKRAKTAHAKTQVELAQYEYMLPRLTRMWTHLSKQKGGIGLRGPGEKEIETDRRIIRDRISLLKKKLSEIDKQKSVQRKGRRNLIRASLIGYTNVGKSTIMNMLSKSNVFAENKLFATLDTTVRKVVIENLPFLLTDTVGFIRKLPHHLVESFKSTLDEVRESEVLLHVVDLSHPNFEEHIAVVNQTLNEMKISDKETMLIFNKVDKYFSDRGLSFDESDEQIKESFAELEKTWMGKINARVVFVSATQKYNIDILKNTMYEMISKMHAKIYPYDQFLY